MLWGIENVVTGSGDDTITASSAVNVMDGGAGNDTFRFLSAADANGDTILGFQPGDKIDLSAIDANTGSAATTPSRWSTGSGFNAAGAAAGRPRDARRTRTTRSSKATSNGGGDAEFQISIKGHHDLTGDDFNL